MSVFICYRHTERLYAFILNERLKLEGIDTCLEMFDAESHQTTDDVCGIFQRNIVDCTHLVMVLGSHVPDAWWLPFGLGAATLLNRRVTLYQGGDLPADYLQRWPTLSNREHIDLFVRAYHDEQTFCRAIVADEQDGRQNNRANAEFFHIDLKAKIRRGF
ncbi:molecular chaperone Tir [Pseudomonas fontis]|uniref:Molecular chaperone Tir n=1 Tax=Pseudomonas fontis TaxID=2942633 RepID=A0ABT5NX06_9PSED|nr:molecular chaperone Tir [Pseudomonas fontis]MDD0974287.1 molecular chaperone Tir [Pseudomonas fontis]MDD0992628.1 molecular chaperone Tir [Pseudomonas fontis]